MSERSLLRIHGTLPSTQDHILAIDLGAAKFVQPHWSTEASPGLDMFSDTSTEVWLDLLPSDVRENIAIRVSHGSQDVNALHLACVSSVQRNEVLSTLKYGLRCDQRAHRLSLGEWISVYGADVKHMTLSRGRNNVPTHSAIFHVFAVSKLRSVSTYDRPEYLSAIAKLAIHTVKVTVRGSGPPCGLAAALSEITTEQLLLSFPIAPEFRDPRIDPWQVLADDNTLGKLTKLTSLDVMCSQSRLDREGSIWDVLTKLDLLRELRIQGCMDAFEEVPEGAVKFLESLESVTLHGNLAAYTLAIAIGTSMKSIRVFGPEIPNDKLVSLSSCSCLKQLQAEVKAGAENSLAKLVKELPALEVLHLDWERNLNVREVSKGKILDAVRLAPSLTELILLHIQIQLSELTAILETIGTKMRRFDVAICRQGESPLERFVALCQAAAKFNPRLREFMSLATANDQYLYEEDARIHAQGESQVLREQRGNLAISMLSRLGARAPLLSTLNLSEDIRKWIDKRQYL